MAEKDEIIPPSCAENLYKSFKGKKRIWVFRGAGHNTWSTTADEKFWKDITDFISGS
jgi:pimeloyl-ACP methyl ester carboxylesterase